MTPARARIVDRLPETSNTATYRLEFCEPADGQRYAFRPGQFNMLYVFGVGEAAISVCSAPTEHRWLAHTIRHVGSVTFGIERLPIGAEVGLRGPFGSHWPLESCRGRDILLVAGGIGIAPLRPAIYEILRERGAYGRLILLYGARSPRDMLFRAEIADWSQRRDFQALTSVDYPDVNWIGPVGVVINLLRRVRLDANRTSVFVCGPRIMNRVAAHAFLSHHVPDDQIFVSLERNMRCGYGQCGHCQYGPKFVCRDGPVFSYAAVRKIFGAEEI
jgi:NAD(P)H-flavin reductase